jgi:hypothetical protein
LVARIGDQNIIFDADPSEAWEIDPRFDRNDHPSFEWAILTFAEPDRFVDFQAKGMTQTVGEPLFETCFF